MNKVNWMNPGGFPDFLNDLDFEQKAVRDAFKAVLNAFPVVGVPNFIISGCELAGGASSPGYIYIGGEILQHEGHTFTTSPPPSTLPFYVLGVSYDSVGDKNMEVGSVAQTYEARKAVVTYIGLADYDASLHVAIFTFGAPVDNFKKRIVDSVVASGRVLLPKNYTWTAVTAFEAGWANHTLDPVPLRYFKDDNGFVHIRGKLLGSGASYKVFTLPVGFRPVITNGTAYSNLRFATYNNEYLTIRQDGSVYSSVISTQVWGEISFYAG
jgi:hypothetical protein